MTYDFKTTWAECKRFEILQIEWEFEQFLNLLHERKVKSVLEIGCWTGGTARGFLDIANKVVSIDCNVHPNIRHLQMFKPGNFLFIQGMTTDPAIREKVGKICPQVDCLFIDADHADKSVRYDFNTYKDLVKPGGLIAFHDTVETRTEQEAKVSFLWEELKLKHTFWQFHDPNNSYINSGIGVIEV